MQDTMTLHDAAQRGCLETARSLLANGADVNAKDAEVTATSESLQADWIDTCILVVIECSATHAHVQLDAS